MFTLTSRFKKRPLYAFTARALAYILSCSLALGPSAVYAQVGTGFKPVPTLPLPSAMLAPTPAFMPALVRGLTVHPENPLKFDFLIDQGDDLIPSDTKRDEYRKLIKYFLTSLTVPEQDLWVNLSPHEQDRIIPGKFGQTEMGRDLLAQDYILKQLTASLIYPEGALGKKFWEKIYKKARERYGSVEVPVNMFNKVWIVPDSAVVFEQGDTAYVADARLRVMLEVDYKSQKFDARSRMLDAGEPSGIPAKQHPQGEHPASSIERRDNVSEEIIRDIIIPELEKEVNEGAHFAQLRQIYNSLILAAWYKQNLRRSLLGQVYIDQNKISGVDTEDKEAKQKIYAQYMQAFEQGVYNYIKEDVDPVTQEIIPRKYFSGGAGLQVSNGLIASTDFNTLPVEAQENIAALLQRLPAVGTGSSPVEIAEVDLLEFKDEDRAAVEDIARRNASSPVMENNDQPLMEPSEFKARRFDNADYAVVEFTPQTSREERLRQRRAAGVTVEASLNARRLLKKFWSLFTPTPLIQKPGINAFVQKLFGVDKEIVVWIKDETANPTGSYKDRAPVTFLRRVEMELGRIENEPVDINREEQEPFRILLKSVSTGNHGRATIGAVNAANRYVEHWGLADRFDLKAEVTLGINAMEHKVQAIRDAGGIVRQYYDEQKTEPIQDYYAAENLVFAELDPASALYDEHFMQIRHADPLIVSSYSGIAHEIVEQLTAAGVHLSQLRAGEMNVVVPLGSGGLTAGMSEMHALFDAVNVFGVTAPETSMAFRSFEEDRIIREPDPNPDQEVLTDGNRATPEPFALARIAEFARAVMLITEQDALYATALLYLNGIIVEPTSGLALALAFIDQEYFDPDKIKHIVIPLTSRNISDKMKEETQRVAALGEEHILEYFQNRRAQVRAAKEMAERKPTSSSPVGTASIDKSIADELTRYIKGYVAEMIYEANHAERTPNKVGGHLAASLSSLEIMAAVHLFVKKGSDHVADKPHASPVLHAIQYLLGELPEDAMHRLRENRISPPSDTDADMVYPYLSIDQRRQFNQFVEKALATFPESAKPQYDDLEGLHSYPGMADRDYVTVPSGSVGLAPAAAIGLALMHKWLAQRGIMVPDAHFFAIIGDAESEIGNLQEILSIASEYNLDNVTFIIDDNRQSLDETVDNRKGLQMLERFRANAWEVIDLKWGTLISSIFDREPGGSEFKALMTALTNREYQELLRLPGEGVRAFLEEKAVQYQIPAGKLKELFNTKTDGELFRIIRDLAGHDLPLLVDQFAQARERKNGRPRVYRTLTIKGNGVEFLEGNERNHGMVPTAKAMAVLREQWGIEPGNPYRKPDTDSDAAEFLRTTAARLSREREQAEQIKESNRNKFNAQIADSLKRFPARLGTGYLPPSTQAYLGNLITRLEKVHDTPVEALEEEYKFLKPFAELFMTIAPDVASSTEQDPQMRDVDRRYNPEHTAGNHFQVGIREMTAMSITGAFGKSREFTGMPTFPILTTYDPFLFRRALDMLFYNAYWGARFIMLGTPSGSSLSAEGAQHQSFLSMFIALALPNVIAWDPAFVLEGEVILADAFRRAATGDDDGRRVVFIRANNLAYRLHQSQLMERLRAQARYQGKEGELIVKEWQKDVLSGGYSLTDHRGDAGYQPGKNAVNIFTAGAMVHEALIVHDLLLEQGIFANIHVVTSPDLLVGRLGARNGYRQLRRLIPEEERSHTAASLTPVLTDVDAAPYLRAIGDILGLGLGVQHLSLEKFGLSTRQPERIHRHHGISQTDLIKEVLAQLALNTMDIKNVNEKGKDVIKGELRALLTGDYILSKAFIEKFGNREMLLNHVLGLVDRYDGPLEGLGQYVFEELIMPGRTIAIIDVIDSPMKKVAQDMQDFIDRHTLPLIEHLNAVHRIKTVVASSPVEGDAGRPRPVSKPKILIVDDDESNRWAMGRIFRAMGYEVIVVEDGAPALERARADKDIKLILTDWNMVTMNGDELARAIQKEGLGIPVIMMTGNISNTDKRRFLEEEKLVKALVDKPVDWEVLKPLIEQFALKSSSPIQDQVGGIDLNPVRLNLQIKRDGSGVPLPVNLQPIETLRIDGFVPVIINITPVLSLPLLSEAVQLSPPPKHAGKEDEYRPSPMAYWDEKTLSVN